MRHSTSRLFALGALMVPVLLVLAPRSPDLITNLEFGGKWTGRKSPVTTTKIPIEDDIQKFFNTGETHRAEVVAVWVTRGWDQRADGIDAEGDIQPWYQNYRDFAPNPP